MTLKGWTLPQTSTGRSSIVAPPPWHYSGEIIAVDFAVGVDAVAALLPRGVVPAPEGTARLLRFTIVLPDEAEVARVAERIGGTEVSDPAGNPLVLVAA